MGTYGRGRCCSNLRSRSGQGQVEVGSSFGRIQALTFDRGQNLWPFKPSTFDHGQTGSNGVKPLTSDCGKTFDLWLRSNGVKRGQTFDLWLWSNLWPLTTVKRGRTGSNYDPRQDTSRRVYKDVTQGTRGWLLNARYRDRKCAGQTTQT